MAKAGVTLDSDEHRVAYAVTALETTRRFDETFKVLRSFDDVRLMANPTEQDMQAFRAIRQKYEPLIRLPRTGRQRAVGDAGLCVVARRSVSVYCPIARDDQSVSSTVWTNAVSAKLNTPSFFRRGGGTFDAERRALRESASSSGLASQ